MCHQGSGGDFEYIVCNANLTPKQSLALHKLQFNISIIIKAADKDGNTVIIDQKDNRKIIKNLNILSNATLVPLKWNHYTVPFPTIRV